MDALKINENATQEQKDAASIIEAALIERKNSNRTMDYSDYERYKQMLHSKGIFGYEYQLAQALEV